MIYLLRVRACLFVKMTSLLTSDVAETFLLDEANDWPTHDGTYDAAGATETSQSNVAAANVGTFSKGQWDRAGNGTSIRADIPVPIAIGGRNT